MYFVTIKNLNFKPKYQIWQNVTTDLDYVDYPYGYLTYAEAKKVYDKLSELLILNGFEQGVNYLLEIDG